MTGRRDAYAISGKVIPSWVGVAPHLKLIHFVYIQKIVTFLSRLFGRMDDRHYRDAFLVFLSLCICNFTESACEMLSAWFQFMQCSG